MSETSKLKETIENYATALDVLNGDDFMLSMSVGSAKQILRVQIKRMEEDLRIAEASQDA